MSDPRWEDRARAAKAARLARVVERVMAEDESITLTDVEQAGDEFWTRVAALADVKHPPSARTVAVVVGLLSARGQRAESA